jgi:C4-type Zn-finger protein
MTQATDTDIRDIKTSIDNLTKLTESIARSTEANTKSITDLTLEMRTGFTSINGKFDTVNARLTNVETNTKVVFDLTEKVGELKNWKQIAIVVFTSSVSGAIAWYIRGGNQ